MPERHEPDLQPDERTALVQFLDYYRDTLALKTVGLSDAQAAAASCPPSPLSLTGLIRHMTEVERSWFQRAMAGRDDALPVYYDRARRPDGDFDLVTPETSLSEAILRWRAEIADANRVIDAVDDLSTPAARSPWDKPMNLRWILVHMIEEYARHCGHADLLRERIDGATGD